MTMREFEKDIEHAEVHDFALGGTRLGILGKGGAGKSTFSVLLARELARRGYEVGLLDADSTNLGLHAAFGFPDAPTPLIEYFGGMVFSGGVVTCPVDDPTPLPNAEVFLSQLPSPYYRRTADRIYLLSGGKLGDWGPGAGCDGPISKIARDLRVRSHTNRSVTLVDLKAGMEDSARGVITSLDWAIVVVDPSRAAIGMAESLGRMVSEVQQGTPPATEHLENPADVEMAKRLFREARVRGVWAILNRVPDINTEVELAEKVSKEAGVEVLGSLREDVRVARAWLRGLPVDSQENRSRVEGIVRRMEAAQVELGSPETRAPLTRMPSGSAV